MNSSAVDDQISAVRSLSILVYRRDPDFNSRAILAKPENHMYPTNNFEYNI